MFYLACTRFNNSTYTDNINYRNHNNEDVIYGTPLPIRNIYPAGSLLVVAEMNNETNKIEGIGLIKNSLVYDKRNKIYENTPSKLSFVFFFLSFISQEEWHIFGSGRSTPAPS